MASITHSTPTPAQQPGLRSYIVCDRLPEGCLSHLVHDGSVAPHLQAGEFAIIDPDDREPMHGELFLIEWGGGRTQVVEIGRFPRPDSLRPRDGVLDPGGYWNAYFQNKLMSLDGRSETGRWFDGPYPFAHLTKKLVGRVVGILEPAFSEPLRLSGEIA